MKQANKRDYRFRDLSLLGSWNLQENDELIDENKHAKGYIHRGNAIHFELKLIRQNKNDISKSGISVEDLHNFTTDIPKKEKDRHLVVVWGVKNPNDTIKDLKAKFDRSITNIDSEKRRLLSAYLFNSTEIVKWKYNGCNGEWITLQ